ncbi:MAG: DUF1080 domain-containing protein [Pirellulales bacterium]|nr:DUF1080 domain-containing protein [Pirellulales bacterium]
MPQRQTSNRAATPSEKCIAITFLALLGTLLFWLNGAIARQQPAGLQNQLSPAEIQAGWILLFDGESAGPDQPLPYGWYASGDAKWEVVAGEIRSSGAQPGFLVTTTDYGDFQLSAEFRAAETTNSGIFLRTVAKPTSPAVDCYELNIAAPEVSPFPTGSLVQRQKSDLSHSPHGPATDDQWHRFEVTFDKGRCTVKLDGQQVLDYTDPRPLGRGAIALQANTGPIAFRNLKLFPLGTEPIFNGRDLTGWTLFPGKASEYSVTSMGELQVKNGPGMLESTGKYGDFVLQWQVQTNGDQLNSGVFFRQIPGEFTQGYECQIQNGYKNGDRTQPVDCGTGGFYRRQNARLVNSNDREWTAVTLVAHGPHMAAWVNGRQVSDWTDTRKPDDNPRKGLRTAAGTFSLQGHDPTTDILFRELKVAEMLPRQAVDK